MHCNHIHFIKKKVAKKLKDTKDHGAIQTASIQVTKEKSKSAGAVVRDIVQYPWLGKCVHFVVRKLLKLFPVETPEDEVKLPYPEKMGDEEAAGMILHKNIPIATYKYMQQSSKCKKGMSNFDPQFLPYKVFSPRKFNAPAIISLFFLAITNKILFFILRLIE